jgi:hypothetical protein
MANGWTPERRAQQAAAIRAWSPWTRSTGPRTAQGRAASSQNATKHGMRSKATLEQIRELRAFLRVCRGPHPGLPANTSQRPPPASMGPCDANHVRPLAIR